MANSGPMVVVIQSPLSRRNQRKSIDDLNIMSLNGDMLLIEHDAIWKALADPTRREILKIIDKEPATTGEIVERFSDRIVRTAVMKHLDVLELARIIRIERVGRTRRNHLEREPLEAVAAWLEKRVQGHQNNLKRLKNLAESNSQTDKNI